MKRPSLLLVSLLAAAAPVHRATADLYWDLNLTAAGAGSNPTGTWDASTANWNSDPNGLSLPGVWTPGDTAVFSAGNDATGPFTVNISGTQTAAGINIQEGTVEFSAGAGAVGTGAITITAGSALSINSATRISGSAGAKVTLNGGTIIQTNPTNALTFIPTAFNLEIGAAGGTVNYTSSGTGAVSIYGGTSGTIVGTGTLTKTGPGEFRYQGLGLPNTTFTKLVVNQGLYRLGFNSNIQDERGFGAVPAVFTPDAITLSGGGSIATSFLANLSVLHANRGITLGVGGGQLLGPLTVPGAITGSGELTILASNTNPVVLTSANDYTGSTTVATGTLSLGSAAATSGSILNTTAVNVNNSTLSLINTAGNADRLAGATPIALRVGAVSLTGNAAADTTETMGLVTLVSGGNTLTISSEAGRVTTLGPASISRGTQNATGLVRGTNLSQATATNVARIIPGDAGASLSLVGTNTLNNAPTSDATQAVKIIPYFFGDTSTTGTGNGFVTYDTTLGLRVVTAAQTTPLTAGYTTASNPDNASVSSDLTLTDASPVTVNSLLFKTAASTLSSASPNTLTVNSGAVATTGAFDYSINDSFSGLALGNGEGVVTVTANTLTIGTPISVTNGGGLSKAGPGTLILTVANAYTGPTTITGGVLQMGHASAIGANAVNITGTRLAIAPNAILSNPIVIGPNTGIAGRGLIEPVSDTATVAGPITINNNAFAGGHFAAPSGTTLIVAGVITAPPSVTVTSRLGTVIFSGGGTGYSNLQIQAETILVGANNGIATTAIVDVASSSTGALDLNGFDQTLAGLARTSNTAGRDATVQNFGAPKTLTLNVAGQIAYAGTIAVASSTGNAIIIGEISLVKNGAGTQTLSGGGANSYTGSTTINGGILKLQKAVNLDVIPFGNIVTINTGGTLQLGQSSQINDEITGFVMNGGTFDLGAFIEGVTPAVTITNGTITGTTAGFLLARGGFLTNGTNTISKSISVRGADLDSGLFNIVSGTTTVNAAIQTDDFSVQGITKTGAGTLILSRTNTYTGPTTVSAGTLEFAASQTLTSLTIDSGAVVRLAPSGPGAAPVNGFANDGAKDGLIDNGPFIGPASAAPAPAQAVPEPGALSLLATGVLGLLGRRRRCALR